MSLARLSSTKTTNSLCYRTTEEFNSTSGIPRGKKSLVDSEMATISTGNAASSCLMSPPVSHTRTFQIGTVSYINFLGSRGLILIRRSCPCLRTSANRPLRQQGRCQGAKSEGQDYHFSSKEESSVLRHLGKIKLQLREAILVVG